jgi:hypothetical protein
VRLLDELLFLDCSVEPFLGCLGRERRDSNPDFTPHLREGVEVWRKPPWIKGS